MIFQKFEGSPGRSRHSSTSSVVSTAELLESYKKSQLQRENARRLKLTAKRLSPHTKPSRTPVKQLAHPPHSSHPFPISEPQNLLVTSGTFVSQPNSTVEELSDGFDEYPANFESQEPASQPDSIFGGASQQRGLTSFDQCERVQAFSYPKN